MHYYIKKYFPTFIIFFLSNALILIFAYRIILQYLFSPSQLSFILSIFFSGCYSFCYLMWIYLYGRLMFQDPGSMIIEKRKINPTPSCKMECSKCHQPKPARAHHCSKCGKCIALFDHHCDALGICVGLRNIKIFVVFIFYSFLLSFCNIIEIVCYSFLFSWKEKGKHFIYDLISNILISIYLGYLLIRYIILICQGQTTYEKIFGILTYKNNDWFKNWARIFEQMSLMWLSPFPTRYEWTNAFYWEENGNKK